MNKSKQINKTELAKYDFIDFGANVGGSIDFAKKRLLGKRGLGIDLDPKRVATTKKAGYDAVVADLTKLDLPPKCVKFVLMSHILEHMPNLAIVEQVIANAERVATDYIVITGPFFDEDEYLAHEGFKLHWSDYKDHPCHLTISQLQNILASQHLRNYKLFVRYPIVCSENIEVHPLNSPSDTKQYNPKVHPPKKHVLFKKRVWTDFVCYIKLKKDVSNWDTITQAYKNAIPYKGASNLPNARRWKLLRKQLTH